MKSRTNFFWTFVVAVTLALATRGVVLDVVVTTGAASERETIEAQVDEVRAIAGREIETVTADAGYAYARVYGGLERRGIDAVIPVRKDPSRSRVPLRRFRYDAGNDILKCPRGKVFRFLRVTGRGRFFRTSDCARCPLRGDCLPSTRINKDVVIPHDYPALLRARRRHARWSEDDRRLNRRHLGRSEGFHGEAKTWLGRAARRGLDNMKIQAYLTAAAINLKRLAAAVLPVLWATLVSRAVPTAPLRANPVHTLRTELRTTAAA